MNRNVVIVADENIPDALQLFGKLGEVRAVPGRTINRQVIADADVLLVRSVTPVDAALVRGTRVRFVGSATIGTDHVEMSQLREEGVTFAHAPGSNAESVAEYVTAAVLEWAVEFGRVVGETTLGVIGYGNIGRKMVQRATAMGMRVLTNDPPLEQAGEAAPAGVSFSPLEDVLAEADVLTLHVPLVRHGVHPTYHLLDDRRLRRMHEDAALINTSRGPVVDGDALNALLNERPRFRAVLDVFEGEPTPYPPLVRTLYVATPHIAGYSYDGKKNGALMLYNALRLHLGLQPEPPEAVALERTQLSAPAPGTPERWLRDLVRQMYDLRADDARMRAMLDLPVHEHGIYFNRLRKEYPVRRTFAAYQISGASIPGNLRNAVAKGLHVHVTD